MAFTKDDEVTQYTTTPTIRFNYGYQMAVTVTWENGGTEQRTAPVIWRSYELTRAEVIRFSKDAMNLVALGLERKAEGSDEYQGEIAEFNNWIMIRKMARR